MAQANEASLLKPDGAVQSANENSKMVNLEDRRTPELVIALVGPVGSGVSYTAGLVASILEEQFAYLRVQALVKIGHDGSSTRQFDLFRHH
jgi:pantothenate kinase